MRKLGFEGPYSGARHQFMVYKTHRLTIPTHPEYSVPQLRMMLHEIENIMDREVPITEWLHL
ncbi:MAG: type II toxin-antitoxin system HicA family toxin [Deltaproteobacteria bacterium]|nr:MAG: type II toxin-antitoxin system HicA family toxin [Deltaproteobacteria bacterium]